MIHVVGFVHTRFDEGAFAHCAYTTKAVRWVDMMAAEGEEITVYWGGDEPVNTAGVADYVSVMSNAEQAHHFGADLPATILNLDWNPDTAHWRTLNHRVAAALYSRLREGDVVAVLSGSNHNGLFHEFKGRTRFVEPWIGYSGISDMTMAKVFESSAWRHLMAGQHRIADGNPLDTVIPNYYRPDDFSVGEDGDYLLFVGRMIRRKGIEEAVEIARLAGKRLVMAGQTATVADDKLRGSDGTEVDLTGVDVEYVGVVGPEARRELYAHASATLVPTIYWEPFGGVFAEAMLSGVLPVCRDWGAFVEYVPAQLRFSTVDQALEALDWAVAHRGVQVRSTAISEFSTQVCAKRFGEWLGRVRAAPL